MNENHVLAGMARSATLKQIWAEAFGPDYPAEAEPLSFVTRDELERMARRLRLGVTDLLVDLGCGTGGPGWWLAEETGAHLLGIDISPAAIELAGRYAGDLARFEVADLAATGLPERSADAVVCIDALMAVPDKAAALAEVRRILRPGGRFAFTSWDFAPDSLIPVPEVDAHQVSDHRHLLAQAGFEPEVYEEPEGWEDRQRAVYAGIRNSAVVLIEEMGEPAALALLEEAVEAGHRLRWRRRVFCVARRM